MTDTSSVIVVKWNLKLALYIKRALYRERAAEQRIRRFVVIIPNLEATKGINKQLKPRKEDVTVIKTYLIEVLESFPLSISLTY